MNRLRSIAVAASLALASWPSSIAPGQGFADLHRMFPWEVASRTGVLKVGDIDGDGDLDVWTTEIGVTSHRLFINDGSGLLTCAPSQPPALADPTSDVALGDVDGDGDLDAYLASSGAWLWGSQDHLFLNDGTGAFSDATAQLPAFLGQDPAVVLGDVDGDGDVDALLGVGAPGSTTTLPGPDRLYLNDGSGTFAYDSTRLPPDSDPASAVALGDLDGDGDLDAVFAVYGGASPQRLCLNDGTGLFSDASAQLPAGAYSASALALGDADGDGDLDLFFGAFGPCTTSGPFSCQSGPARLFLNDGAAALAETPLPPSPGGGEWTASIALGDLDGDGDLDAFLGNNGPCAWNFSVCPPRPESAPPQRRERRICRCPPSRSPRRPRGPARSGWPTSTPTATSTSSWGTTPRPRFDLPVST